MADSKGTSTRTSTSDSTATSTSDSTATSTGTSTGTSTSAPTGVEALREKRDQLKQRIADLDESRKLRAEIAKLERQLEEMGELHGEPATRREF